MCTKVNIEGFHTNHSLVKTTRSSALGKSVPEKLVMDHMGHRDVKSLYTYQRESGREREAVSDVLQGSKRSPFRGLSKKSC